MSSASALRPSILYACRANAGRSVTARVLTEYYARGQVDVHSAGSEPASRVHPEIAAALGTIGLSTAAEIPKPFDPHGQYTAVITMGCGDTCPFYLGARYEDWPIHDPKGQDQATVGAIVQDIDARVRELLVSLVPGMHLSSSPMAT